MPGAPAHPDADTSQKEAEVVQLGPGDQIKMDVLGRPEMSTQMYVGADGTIRVPLAGFVKVLGLSPEGAAQLIEKALRDGLILRQPQVSLQVMQTLNRVSVFGEVKTPGRYPIESNTTVLDVLAQAGGRSEKGDDVAYLMRRESSGHVSRFAISLKTLSNPDDPLPDVFMTKLHGGDQIYVPLAHQFSIFGEVRNPAKYRLDSGMTVLQAISAAGGVTEKGSTHRIEIKRVKPGGAVVTVSAKLTDAVEADDIITIKERWF
jgi:polysaccharide export outer membrane protein